MLTIGGALGKVCLSSPGDWNCLDYFVVHVNPHSDHELGSLVQSLPDEVSPQTS